MVVGMTFCCLAWPGVQKDVLMEFVTDFLLIHNIQPGMFQNIRVLMWEKGLRYKAKGENQCHPQGACARRSVDSHC